MKKKKPSYYQTLPHVLITLLLFIVTSLSAQSIELIGAGATFPYPLYSKMFDVYNQQYKIKVNYQSIGSGGGIQQLIQKTIDFGATDAFMTDEELQKSSQKIIHIPICIGSVAVTYNLDGNPPLQLSPQILSEIFLGTITEWDDPKIRQANPLVNLPKKKILVVHRSDGSGTSFIFTDYLSKVSETWKTKVGAGKSVNWPTGLAAKGNEGVTGLVKQSKNSLGYCELSYALQTKMPTASIQNATGAYVAPDIATTSAAAEIQLPADTRITITNTAAAKGYPIASFTWLILYQEQNYAKQSKEKAAALVQLIQWMATDGQRFAAPLEYAPLPVSAQHLVLQLLKSVTFDGKSVIQ
ncbi:MAG: phosphate ABC transporter substrate-binding protein PstS [Chitinivibrionales bacterium]|nr:phosphate ABC transporter substrate-binding protein PstS [Chitinivibrionales bacterium]